MNRLFRTALGALALASSLACACSPETIEEPKHEDPLIIEVSRTEVPLTCDGGIVYVTVSAPAEVSAVSDAEWCEAEILADREQNNLRLTVEPAQEEEAREAVVTLSSEGCDDVTVTVSQEGREIPKSTECDLLTFSIPAEANGLDSPIEFDFDEQTRTLDAMYLKWIEKDSPEMLIPEFTMTGVKAYADGVEIVSGETPVSFAEDVHLTVEAESGDVKEYVVTLNCPQINVELPVLRLQPEREIVDKENYVDTKVTLYSPFTDSGWWNPDDEPVAVRGRGNSTWGLPKKPYRLKFPDKVSPIGLNHTEAKSWVILAHDMDKSLLRNHLAFEVSKIMYNPSDGWHDPSAILFTPCSQFVNVYMNDDYHGIYQMSDQMEQREGRIAVEELTDKDGADPEKITGGYIIETDIHEGNRYTACKNIRMTYKYPDDEEYDPAQYQYIADFIDNAESVLYSSDFKDPETGWRRRFDEKTLVDFVIIKDISHNDRAVRAYRNAVIRAFRHGTFIAKRRTVRCISGSIGARCCTIICADTCVISCCTALLNLFTNMRPGAQSNTECGIVTNRGRISPHCHRFRRIFSNAYLSSHGNRITCTGFHSRVAFIISTTTGADSNGLHGIIRNFSISANCQTIGVVSDF